MPVAAFLDVFATWLTADALPTMAAQTARLEELALALPNTAEVHQAVAHLQGLLGKLEGVAGAIEHAPASSDIEMLAERAAEHSNEARALIARARWLVAREASDRTPCPDRDPCRPRPD